jgi:hypothetical protein
MRTAVYIGWRRFVRVNLIYGLRQKVMLWRHVLFGEEPPFITAYFDFSARKQAGPLDAKSIAALTEFQSRQVGSVLVSRSREVDPTLDVPASDPQGANSSCSYYRPSCGGTRFAVL